MASLSPFVYLLSRSHYFSTSGPTAEEIIAVHSGDYFQTDLLRADSLALPDVGAASEHFLFHLRDHIHHPLVPFGLTLWKQPEMTDFGSRKERSRSVRARCNAGAAANACSRIHREVRFSFGYQNHIPVG